MRWRIASMNSRRFAIASLLDRRVGCAASHAASSALLFKSLMSARPPCRDGDRRECQPRGPAASASAVRRRAPGGLEALVAAQVQTCLWVACYARDQLGSWDSQSFVARVRAGAEVTASPRLAFVLS
jgi:hypothetical protein